MEEGAESEGEEARGAVEDIRRLEGEAGTGEEGGTVEVGDEGAVDPVSSVEVSRIALGRRN